MQPVRQLMAGNQAFARKGKQPAQWSKSDLGGVAQELIDDNATIAIADPSTPLTVYPFVLSKHIKRVVSSSC